MFKESKQKPFVGPSAPETCIRKHKTFHEKMTQAKADKHAVKPDTSTIASGLCSNYPQVKGQPAASAPETRDLAINQIQKIADDRYAWQRRAFKAESERDELLELVKLWLAYWEQTDAPESAITEYSRAVIAKVEGSK
jgi:hypothetical protein